jgi:hypothetical protein
MAIGNIKSLKKLFSWSSEKMVLRYASVSDKHSRLTDEVEMKKRLQNPMVITNVYFLGKGEVACSNHASSTILLLGL